MAYVYKHKRLDTNEIFYIGIGTQDKFKRAFSKLNRSQFWKNITSKIDYEIIIVKDGLSWGEACIEETKLIKFYGRRDLNLGTLVNMTDGGDGSVNVIHSDQWYEKQKLNNNKKGKPISDSHKQALIKFVNSPSYINGAAKPILVFNNNIFIKEYSSIKAAANELRLKRSLIDRYLKGLSIRPRHTYHFRYK